MNKPQSETFPLVGWREWLSLPELGITRIKAKIDTGARTSALHAFFVDPYRRGAQEWVRFGLHPLQHRTDIALECDAPVKDRRIVSDSGGHRQWRYVIETRVILGHTALNIEINLTDRDTMLFRLLLGRTAVRDHFHIDAGASYMQGEPVLDDRSE